MLTASITFVFRRALIRKKVGCQNGGQRIKHHLKCSKTTTITRHVIKFLLSLADVEFLVTPRDHNKNIIEKHCTSLAMKKLKVMANLNNLNIFV